MLFNFPSFIGEKEQTPSELLYNNIKIMIQTHIGEIWTDLDFGTDIRNLIKQGINNITLVEISDELETKLNTYFGENIVIDDLKVQQEQNVVKVNLRYIELRTGIHYSMQTEETINNSDNTLY